MGLDNYFVKPYPDSDGKYESMDTIDFEKPLAIIGGMFSAAGGTGPSFRGKCYNGFVEMVTGVSLYEDFVPNSTVREMAREIEEAVENGVVDPGGYDISQNKLKDFSEFFSAYADAGAALISWY